MTALKVVNTKELTKNEWLEYRKSGIGGSDVSAILGLNKYKNRISVWLEKTGQIENVNENFKMEMGNRLEPVVAEMFAERNPELKIKKNNFLLRHNKISCMLANIDREVICPIRGRGILEIKTTGDYNKKEWTSETVPDMYMLQLQHYLAVTGYKFGYFACLIGGNTDFKTYLVERDEQIIEYIEQECMKFWESVETMEMPQLDGTDASMEALKIIYPFNEAEAEEIHLPIHLQEAFHEYLEIKKKEDRLEERKRALQAQIITELGNNHIGRLGSYIVNWKPQMRSTVNTKLLKERYPEIHAEVMQQGESRPFKVSYKE